MREQATPGHETACRSIAQLLFEPLKTEGLFIMAVTPKWLMQ